MIATAIQNGEYDFDGTRNEKLPPPILLRAEDVKAEIKDATGKIKPPCLSHLPDLRYSIGYCSTP